MTPPQEDLRAVDQVRASLVAAGYYEALTFSWVSDALREDFKPAEAKGLLRADESVRKDNAHLRPSIIPGLLEAVRRNENVGNLGARFFEVGSTFWVIRRGTWTSGGGWRWSGRPITARCAGRSRRCWNLSTRPGG